MWDRARVGAPMSLETAQDLLLQQEFDAAPYGVGVWFFALLGLVCWWLVQEWRR